MSLKNKLQGDLKMKRKNLITKISLFSIAFALAIQAISMINLSGPSVYASTVAFTETVTITNGSFNNYKDTTSLDESPSGWTKVNAQGSTSGVINVVKGNMANYELSAAENPGKNNDSLDNKVLMINAKSKNNALPKNTYFKSNSFSIFAYSYYELSVLVNTQSGANASVYFCDIDSTNKTPIFAKKENISTEGKWKLVKLYLATDREDASAQIELFLGNKENSSNNAVFFDEVKVKRITKAAYSEATESTYVAKESLLEYVDLVTNPDFESNLDGWTNLDTNDVSGANARVLNVTNGNEMNNFDLDYIGHDNSKSDNNALVIYSSNNTAYGVESNNIVLKNHKIYKISVNVKVSENITGGAFVAVQENDDVLDFYSSQDMAVPENFYTPNSKNVNVKHNSENQFINGYTTVTFYIKNHTLYDTSVNLQLSLGYRKGEDETLAKGYAIFDSVSVEEVTHLIYENAVDSDTTVKLQLNTLSDSSSLSVTNGLFNNTEIDDTKNAYPTKASNWTITEGSSTECVNGVINTNNVIYNANKSYYGNIANPSNKELSTNDVNNIYMMWNKSSTYQRLESPSFSVNADTINEISFDLKTIATGSENNIVNIYVADVNDRIVYKDINVASANWTTYTILVKTTNASESLHLIIELGNKENPVIGYAFIDNVKSASKTMTDDEYANHINFYNTIDFSNGRFNLRGDEKDTNNLFEALAYEGKIEEGNANSAYGGIIDGRDNEFNFTNCTANNNLFKNMLLVETTNDSTYSLTSKYKVNLSASNYYKFTIYVKTRLNDVEVEDDQYYGAEFSLSGLDKKITGIISNEDWTKYEIFVQTTNDVEVAPRFALKSLSFETKGFAVFDNYSFETITESVYSTALNEFGEDSKTALFIGDTDKEEEEEEPESQNKGSNFDWLLLPTLITGLAIIVAIVGFTVRKIKFKKFTKRKQNEYDRNKTLYRDVFRKEAEDLRNKELKQYKDEIAKVEEELKELEEENQNRMKLDRESGKTTIDSKVERNFKAYASKHTNLLNKIDRLQQKIESISTDEYLLVIQKKMISQKIKEDALKRKNEKAERKNKTK